MKRKAYSYIRMSTETQLKGDSLRRQLEASKEYAEKNNLELVESIDGKSLQDIGVSGFRGKNSQKGVLADFLDALDQGKIEPNSVLLIESLDRLSRNYLSEAVPLFISILNKNIEIVTLADNQNYTKELINKNPGAIFISLGVMYRANEESEIKSKRLKSAWSNKRNNINTKILTRTCPAWLQYSATTEKFEVIEEKAEVVKKIFDMCINTGGLFSIARYLNENKIPVFGRGKLWYLSYIKKIISNRAVLGEFTPHKVVDGKRVKDGEPVTNYFPTIISETTFLQAQAAISRRTAIGKGRKGTNFSNLFAGITYCAHCDYKMMVRAHGGNRRSSKYLFCSNSLVKGGCVSAGWNLADFEALMLKHLREINFADLIVTHKPEKKISLADEANVLEEKIKVKETEFDKTYDLLMSSYFSVSAKSRLEKKLNLIDAEIQSLNKELEEKQKEMIAAAGIKEKFSEKEFKTFLEKLDANQDDYLFRSAVNNLFIKLIERIELREEKNSLMPWELTDDHAVIKAYRSAFKGRENMPLEQIVNNHDFIAFNRNFNRTIVILYKSGILRYLCVGYDASMQI